MTKLVYEIAPTGIMLDFTREDENLIEKQDLFKELYYTSHQKFIETMWNQFSLPARPKEVDAIGLTNNPYCETGFTLSKDGGTLIVINIAGTNKPREMFHETAHYLHFLRNPQIFELPYWKGRWIKRKTLIGHFIELVAEYGVCDFIEKNSSLEPLAQYTTRVNLFYYNKVKEFHQKNSGLLQRLATMDEKSVLAELPHIIEKMRVSK